MTSYQNTWSTHGPFKQHEPLAPQVNVISTYTQHPQRFDVPGIKASSII